MNPHNVNSEAQVDSGEPQISEEEYLRREVERSRQALAASVNNLMYRLREAKSIERWARRYPWPTVGAAAAAGFTAATIVTPSKDDSMRDKLRRLGKHVNRLKPENPTAATAAATEATAKASTPLAAMTIIHSLFDLAKMLIERTAPPPAPRNMAPTAPVSPVPGSPVPQPPVPSSAVPPHHHAHD
jgi:ElaB/YqjD/DUF883 family membrane-anchored ribosome-binding protein